MSVAYDTAPKVGHRMTQLLDLYDRLSSATDDRTRARVIADAFAELEQRYPQLSDIATQASLKESELKLTKEIEQVRAEIKETELKLTKEIEQVRTTLERSRANILIWSFGFWFTQMVALAGILWRLTSAH